MARITTLEVHTGEHTFQLTAEDDILLFEAKAARGRDFDFTPPGSDEPVHIEIHGLRFSKSHSFTDD